MLFLAATGFAGAQQLTLSEQNMPPEFTAAYSVMKGPLKVGELDVALEQTEPGTWVYHSSTTPFGIAAVFLGLLLCGPGRYAFAFKLEKK